MSSRGLTGTATRYASTPSAGEGVHRSVSSIFDSIDEFLGVASVRPGDRVRAEHDLDVLAASSFEDIRYQRQTLLHPRESFLVIVSDPEKFRLVVQIVMQHQEIRIE